MPPEAEAHTASCELCSQLLEAQASLGKGLGALATGSSEAPRTPEGSMEELFAAVQADVAADLGVRGWLRQRPTGQRIALALALPALLLIALGLLARRADFASYPHARMGLELALYALLTVLAVRRALRPTHLRSSSYVRWGMVVASLALPFTLALLAPAHLDHPASLAGAGADFWPRAIACFRFGFALSLPVLAILAWGDRLETKSISVAALMGATASLVANFLLHVHCPITNAEHMLVGHAGIGLALLPLAAVLAWLRRGRIR